MTRFRDVFVWQISLSFVTEICKVSKPFPKEEIFCLISQLRRYAVSKPSNILEGYGRDGVKEYLRFLNIAFALLFELQRQLEIVFNLYFIMKKGFEELYEVLREIERMVSNFIGSIKSIKTNLSLQFCNYI
jgi:four helix bundle protein